MIMIEEKYKLIILIYIYIYIYFFFFFFFGKLTEEEFLAKLAVPTFREQVRVCILYNNI